MPVPATRIDAPPANEPFRPTDEQRRTVRAMSGYGIPQKAIAAHIGCSLPTLHKKLRAELDAGETEANTAVAQTLFRMATSGENTAASIFWLKARAEWREKHEIEVTNNVRVSYVVRGPTPVESAGEWLDRYSPKPIVDSTS